jgi:hypothetical protein
MCKKSRKKMQLDWQWQRSWARGGSRTLAPRAKAELGPGGQQDIDDFGKNFKLFLLFPWQYLLIDSPAA